MKNSEKCLKTQTWTSTSASADQGSSSICPQSATWSTCTMSLFGPTLRWSTLTTRECSKTGLKCCKFCQKSIMRKGMSGLTSMRRYHKSLSWWTVYTKIKPSLLVTKSMKLNSTKNSSRGYSKSWRRKLSNSRSTTGLKILTHTLVSTKISIKILKALVI